MVLRTLEPCIHYGGFRTVEAACTCAEHHATPSLPRDSDIRQTFALDVSTFRIITLKVHGSGRVWIGTNAEAFMTVLA
jgi:hypothetical protein